MGACLRRLSCAAAPADAPGEHQGCKCMIAIERRLLDSGKPDPDSAYWN